MKRYKKKEMLSLLKTLEKANDTVWKSMAANPPGITDVLIQCQENAVGMGNYLETLGAEPASAVTLLESYCETLYQISIKAPDENACRKWFKKARKELREIADILQRTLPKDRREIVFLPYKAAMWDSLESIWAAAKADADCDAYVMPIPYFDKKPDGSLGEMHCEGDQYPGYVPLLNWQEHDLEAWHPDQIYIHNPYDECNYVTSVHPAFYASRLRAATDQLIYIPYFIHQNDTVKEMYCTLPGVFFADVVVLQSEKVRAQYIEYFQKITGIKENLDKKFLACGSPKFDARASYGKEELPEEWRRLIWQEGKKRRVIFLNTHLNLLMAPYCGAFFEKLQTIFDVFCQNRSVVLWWRPHPLSEATAKSMNPEALARYQEIVQGYRDEKWGIYDDTPDLHRAVELSDAYYGCRSSVIELFKAAAKPVMVMKLR